MSEKQSCDQSSLHSLMLSRFQDDDDIFGFNDAPPQVTTTPKSAEPPVKKSEPPSSTFDFLDMASSKPQSTPSRSKLTEDIEAKPEQKPEPSKPSPAPAATSTRKAADWLGLKDDSDDEMEAFKSGLLAQKVRVLGNLVDYIALKLGFIYGMN